jgi:uncharacterized protein RhaS with RHS repeats
MKTQMKHTIWFLTLLALLAAPHLASAYYDPGVQRWINRDPVEERGGLNLYAFVVNNPIGRADSYGLKLWVCTRPTIIFGGVGTHAYFWDDRNGIPLKDRSCGKHGSSGSNTGQTTETGPNSGATTVPWKGVGPHGPAECYPVDDSDNREGAVMQCCKKNAAKGIVVPYGNDCHDFIDDCLKANDLHSPPHSRGDAISNHAKDIQCACEDY